MLLLPKEFQFAAVCAVVFQADLAEGFRAGYGCNFSTWETNGECDFAGDGLHEQPQNLPSAESVWSSRKASQITSFDSSVCTNRSW